VKILFLSLIGLSFLFSLVSLVLYERGLGNPVYPEPEAFQRMGIQRVAPCHCTGDRAMAMFESEYGERFIEAGAGCIIKL